MRDVFDRLDEIAGALAPDQWMLVGGLMVHAHAREHSVQYTRPTDDVDLVLELQTVKYPEAAHALGRLGYEPHHSVDSKAPFHRFVRGSEVIDVMAPEGRPVRFVGRTVMAVAGSRSALRRTVTFTTVSGVSIRMPDLLSALSLKGAALESSSPNQVRHLQDSVILFACLDAEPTALSNSMRANVNRTIRSLGSPAGWTYANSHTRRRAVRGILAIQPTWVVPSFVLPRRPGRNDQPL